MAHDSIDKRARVLVVEDIDTARKAYVRNLTLENAYRVDTAGDLAEASAALDSCTYHVALVDIMLAGERDVANRDGVTVIKRIDELNEGTQAVVLSAQPEKQLIREFLKEYGAFDYLDKEVLNETGVDLMIEFVAKAVAASPVGQTPPWDDVVRCLAGDMSEPEFVSQLMKRVTFGGGFENLSRTLASALRHLLPMMPPQTGPAGLQFDDQRQGFVSRYWSKGQGCAVEFGVFGRQDATARDASQSDALLLTREKAGLEIVVTRLAGLARDAYAYSPA